MMDRLGISQRDRRTLTLGAVVIGTLFVVARGVPALREWEHDRISEAVGTADELARLKVGLRSLPALRDSLRARKARLASLDSVLLGGTSPAGAAAELASAVGDIADENSLKVTSLQLRSDSVPTAGLARVQVRLTGVADITGLAGFLRAVEGSDTPLVVREVSVSQPEPAAADAKPETLRIDLLVESLGRITKEKAP